MRVCYNVRRAGTFLLPLEPLAVEPQRAAVFGHGAHELIARAVGEPGFDFDGYGDVGSHLAGKMRDSIFGVGKPREFLRTSWWRTQSRRTGLPGSNSLLTGKIAGNFCHFSTISAKTAAKI